MSVLNLIFFIQIFPLAHDEPILQDTVRLSDDSPEIIEKVYLHTDRSIYFPGEDIWFKAYLIDAADRKLTDHSSILHVEILSPLSEIIESRAVRLGGGLGNGDFRLSEDIRAGKYILRAYTNYMHNYGDQLFFTKPLTVINPSDTASQLPGEGVDEGLSIGFYPEGGSLVENIPSTVAFKATDETGRGCSVTGDLFSSAGNLLKSFKTSYQGMGSFMLRPVHGLTYYAIVKDEHGNSIKADLPEIFPVGVTLGASVNENYELHVNISANSQSLPLIIDKDLVLTFSKRKEPIRNIVLRVKSYNNSIELPTGDLPEGIITLTLSGSGDLPLAERLIFIPKKNDFRLFVKPDKAVYNRKDSVEIAVAGSIHYGYSREAYLSLTVVKKDFLDEKGHTISSWFLLESDIHGQVENPASYFDASDPGRLQKLDLLLLTHGWRDFTWKSQNTYFPPEHSFSISGRIKRMNSDKSLYNSKISIGFFNERESLFTMVATDSSGYFQLDDLDIEGKANVVLSVFNSNGQPQRCLVLLDSLEYDPAGISGNFHQFGSKPGTEVDFRQEYEIREAILKKYKLSDTLLLGEVSIISRKSKSLEEVKIENVRHLYGKPDNELILTPKNSDYNNVFEALKGKFAGVVVITNTGSIGPTYDVIIRGGNSFGKSKPLMLIDGRQASSQELAAIPMGTIDRIDVLKSAGTIGGFGVRGSAGVISVITKTADNTPLKKPENTYNAIVSGFDAPRTFYSPRHLPSNPDPGPDLRTTLFWVPDLWLQSDKSKLVHYYNADSPAKVKIVVEGITSDGIPLTASAEYEIK